MNYAVPAAAEEQLHELFLRYRAPTMGGPLVHSKLDEFEVGQMPSQSEFIRFGRQPIWSGGTYWPQWPQPVISEKVEHMDRRDQLVELRAAACDLDDPSDEGVVNVRLWKEMLEDKRPGEYFAVKEQKLFGWDEKKFVQGEWRNTTAAEKISQHHFDWHFVWRGDQIHREKTTEGMRRFYSNNKFICDVLHENVMKYQELYENMERAVGLWCSMWNEWDYDLIDQRLRQKHHIDLLDKEVWSIVGDDEDKEKQQRIEFTQPFWYWEEEGQPDAPWEHATGEDVADGGPTV